MVTLTDKDKQLLSTAIKLAETQTSGEIVVAVVRDSGDYLAYSLLVSLAVAFLIQAGIYLFFPYATEILMTSLPITLLLSLLFIESSGIVSFLIPYSHRHKLVRRAAKEQFLDNNLHTTTGRSAIFIFVSLEERCVEILTDIGINAQVPTETWSGLAASIAQVLKQRSLTEALETGIERSAAILREHYPPMLSNSNELSDEILDQR